MESFTILMSTLSGVDYLYVQKDKVRIVIKGVTVLKIHELSSNRVRLGGRRDPDYVLGPLNDYRCYNPPLTDWNNSRV